MYYDHVVTCISCGHNQYATTERCIRCGGELKPADEDIAMEMREDAIKAHENAAQQRTQQVLRDIREGKYKENINSPKCPICKSTNIRKISVAKRAIYAYTLGLFSNTARSQWECLNCNNKF